jgi:hypothetical protein
MFLIYFPEKIHYRDLFTWLGQCERECSSVLLYFKNGFPCSVYSRTLL